MNFPPPKVLSRLLPRSLFSRLALILFCGLGTAHALSFWLIGQEREQTAKTMMSTYLAKDVAIATAILERTPVSERPAWLVRLQRRNFRYVLGSVPEGEASDSAAAGQTVAAISSALGPSYAVTATQPTPPSDAVQLRLHLRLADGTPLTVEVFPPRVAGSPWPSVALALQLLVLAGVTWLAVRVATRPLAQLARAADALRPEHKVDPLDESGPVEVAQAAKAFNAMQRRIADYLTERVQILAAISHDLQTPITRMRLRAELLDNDTAREKLQGDLNAMQELVEEGIAYARSAQGSTEAAYSTDLHALLDSLVCDYVDAGQGVRLVGSIGKPITTRPKTLKRIIINLVNNALKFAKDVEVVVEPDTPDRVSIAVRDRGPGVPASELKAVLQPFYRVESSRNRETGGTGLGLAIAQQLALALGGTLTLSNRSGGGLEARLSLPAGVNPQT